MSARQITRTDGANPSKHKLYCQAQLGDGRLERYVDGCKNAVIVTPVSTSIMYVLRSKKTKKGAQDGGLTQYLHVQFTLGEHVKGVWATCELYFYRPFGKQSILVPFGQNLPRAMNRLLREMREAQGV